MAAKPSLACIRLAKNAVPVAFPMVDLRIVLGSVPGSAGVDALEEPVAVELAHALRQVVVSEGRAALVTLGASSFVTERMASTDSTWIYFCSSCVELLPRFKVLWVLVNRERDQGDVSLPSSLSKGVS
jgi:hypothetical protein